MVVVLAEIMQGYKEGTDRAKSSGLGGAGVGGESFQDRTPLKPIHTKVLVSLSVA